VVCDDILYGYGIIGVVVRVNGGLKGREGIRADNVFSWVFWCNFNGFVDGY